MSDAASLVAVVLRSVLVGALCLAPCPAWAGTLLRRDDPCPEPRQAIPETERQQIEAAAGATVQAIHAGVQASGSSEHQASYRVAAFSDEGFEGAWLRYAMCKQRAAGVISPEEYAQFLSAYGLTNGVGRVVVPASTPVSEEEDTGHSGSWVGSWSVTTTFAWSACAAPNDTHGTAAYDWLISREANGAYEVEVRGKTRFTSLSGGGEGSGLRLVGAPSPTPPGTPTPPSRDQTVYVLDIDGDEFHGRRVLALTVAEEGGGLATCAVEFEVDGERK